MQLTLLTKPFCAGAWGKNFKSTDVFTKPTVNSSPLSIAFDLQPSNIFHEYIRTTSIPADYCYTKIILSSIPCLKNTIRTIIIIPLWNYYLEIKKKK